MLEAVKTWVAYVGVLATAVIVAYGGIRKALKDLGKHDPGKPVSTSPVPTSIVGGTIMETTTLLMWSESNRDMTEATNALRSSVEKLTTSTDRLCDQTNVVDGLKDEAVELSHQIERLRDKL